MLSIVGAYFFYRRFPNNYLEPNFYAEDGGTFYQTLRSKGLIGAILTPFSGYSVAGLYILDQIAAIVNSVFFHGEFVNIPRAFAVVSYGFLGALCALPVILLRRLFKPWYLLVLLYILLLIVPMPGSDYAIIGILGNFKFAFAFIAFVLLIYRVNLPVNSRKHILVDGLLVICAYTNVTVYLLLPFALIPYIPYIQNKKYKELFGSISFKSLVGLGLLIIPQVLMIMLHGIPNQQNYLDGPYRAQSTIEIFGWRTLLFPIAIPFLSNMNDALVISLLVAIIALAFILLKKTPLYLFLFSVYASVITTALFVIKRTGIGDLYGGYQSSGPDQFFYAQNMIFIVGIVLLFSVIAQRIPSTWYRRGFVTLITILVIAYYMPLAGSYGENNFMEKNIGNIYQLSHAECKTSKTDLTLKTYPNASQNYYHLSRGDLCTKSTIEYYPRRISFNLEPDGNQYVAGLGSSNSIQQTFRSPQKNLTGVSVYFSTFSSVVRSSYVFTLYDVSCKNMIRRVGLHENNIKDNKFYTIYFTPIDESLNQSYCFTISSEDTREIQSPLALQLSRPNVYKDGDAILNNKPLESDVVFELQYK